MNEKNILLFGMSFSLRIAQKIVHDESVLTQEQRDYLNQAPDLEEYVNALQEYSKKILFYVKQKEWQQKKIEYIKECVADEILEKSIESSSSDRL
jgi:hypothetical protein